MAAQRGVPEPGVLDPGDQFWLEAMADAVLILSPVRGRNQHVSDFRVEYANAATAELADERTADRLRPGGLIGSRFLNLQGRAATARDHRLPRSAELPTSRAPSTGCAIASCGRARRSTRCATCASADTAIGSSSRCVTSPPRAVGTGGSAEREEPSRSGGRGVRRGADDRRPHRKRAQLEHRRGAHLRIHGTSDGGAALFGAVPAWMAGRKSCRGRGHRAGARDVAGPPRTAAASGRASRLLPYMARTARCAGSSLVTRDLTEQSEQRRRDLHLSLVRALDDCTDVDAAADIILTLSTFALGATFGEMFVARQEQGRLDFNGTPRLSARHARRSRRRRRTALQGHSTP